MGKGQAGGRDVDGVLKLQTLGGYRELDVQVFRSHLDHKTAEHVAAGAARGTHPTLILAPHIGAGLAARLSEADVNYLDASGNCHIKVPPLYIHVEGKSPTPRPAIEKGLRSAGFQVLFAYLAEPPLLEESVRSVAEAAGVSRQAVSDMRHRLLDEGYVLSTKSRRQWHPRRRQDALSMWLHGYESTVRPSLLQGSYRTRKDINPADLERRLTQILGETVAGSFRWGGTAAGFRIIGHYRGECTVIHVRNPPQDLPTRIPALSAPKGNLVVMDAFGSLNWAPHSETVHPLLVYSEMLYEGSDRSREAAEILFDQHLAWAKERA